LETIIETILRVIVVGGPQALAVAGWGLYIVERYYSTPKREQQYRKDLEAFRSDYKSMSENMSETISRFTIILEVLKDRIGR
jgi:hypothetical protein